MEGLVVFNVELFFVALYAKIKRFAANNIIINQVLTEELTRD